MSSQAQSLTEKQCVIYVSSDDRVSHMNFRDNAWYILLNSFVSISPEAGCNRCSLLANISPMLGVTLSTESTRADVCRRVGTELYHYLNVERQRQNTKYIPKKSTCLVLCNSTAFITMICINWGCWLRTCGILFNHYVYDMMMDAPIRAHTNIRAARCFINA